MTRLIQEIGRNIRVRSDASCWTQLSFPSLGMLWRRWRFFKRDRSSLVTRHSDMVTWIDIGVGMAFIHRVVAMQSAAVTLVKGDLRALAKAIHLSHATMRNIPQKLFFAFGYKSMGIPIASYFPYPFFGVLLSPKIAGVAIRFRSVSVITNALRLRQVRI
jgi:cation transport ATPase